MAAQLDAPIATAPAPSTTLRLRVKSKSMLADGVAGFELESADGATLPGYAPGAHLEVHLPNGIKRQYSLCKPSNGLTYSLGVLRAAESRGGSAAMHDQVGAGDVLVTSMPRNLFALKPAPGKVLLLAGGIGITPILCMAEALAEGGDVFELHYAARAASRMAFAETIRASGYGASATLYIDDEEFGERLVLASLVRAQPEDTHLYVCGPHGFIQAALAEARSAGWSEERLNHELFAAPAVLPGEVGAKQGEFDVRLQRSGRVIRIAADQTIFEALAEAGVEVETSCEQGVCGTCLTAVIEGTPDHRDSYLTAQEQAANDQMLVCCSRSKSPVLVLDL